MMYLRYGALLLSWLFAESAYAIDLLGSYNAALEQDSDYLMSIASADAAREALPQARAQLLPNISVNAGKYKNDLNTSQPYLGKTYTSQTDYDSSQYTISIKQPIYRKYQFSLYSQAKYQVTAAEEGLQKDRSNLGVRVAEAYFNVLLAQDQYLLIQTQKKAYAAQLDGAKHSYKAGEGTKTDIDEAQAKYDMAVAQELDAEQGLAYAKRQLGSITNTSITGISKLDVEKFHAAALTPNNLSYWLDKAQATSHELSMYKAQISAAEQEVEKAKAGHYPTVDFIVQRDRSQSQNITQPTTLYLQTQVGVQATVPIFSGGYVNSGVRQATANLEKARQQYEVSRRKLYLSLQKEFQNINEGVLKIAALQQASMSAQNALRSTKMGIKAGTRTTIDLLNAEQQVTNAARDLAKARYEHLLSRLHVYDYAGELDEQHIREINGLLSSDK